jgi:hypothetical protein
MMKSCSACKEDKDLSLFGKSSSSKDGLVSVCSLCRKAKSAEYYVKNKEKVSNRNKLWATSNKEKHKNYLKSWYSANKERVLEEDKQWYLDNREAALSRGKEWRERNPGIVRERTSRRRIAVKQATPKWLTADDISAISTLYRQAASIEKETNNKYHVDHIVPLRAKAACGLHVPWNLQVIPAKENLMKSNALAAALSA